MILGALCCVAGELIPLTIVRAYMVTTEQIESIAAPILRTYFTAFVFLVFNVFSTYYYQSTNRPGLSMLISLMRGIVISGVMLYVLPPIFGGGSVWFAVPISEAAVFVFVLVSLKANRKKRGQISWHHVPEQ